VRFVILITSAMNIAVFLDVTPWSLVQTQQSFWEICCFHL